MTEFNAALPMRTRLGQHFALLRKLVRKTTPYDVEAHFDQHINRLTETSVHLLADIGLEPSDHEPHHTARARVLGGIQGRHF